MIDDVILKVLLLYITAANKVNIRLIRHIHFFILFLLFLLTSTAKHKILKSYI